jgi:hypothetical protein
MMTSETRLILTKTKVEIDKQRRLTFTTQMGLVMMEVAAPATAPAAILSKVLMALVVSAAFSKAALTSSYQ